jgi:hypothetical protein
VWFRALALLALPGCFVSFNDYPLGDPTPAAGSQAGAGSVAPSAGSSSGGALATAGSSEGGAPDVPMQLDTALAIDDFEDGDAAILELQGRSGGWYVANDGRGMQTPPGGTPLVPSALVPARGSSARGAHTFGGPFSTWGALIGTVFASNANTGVPYDLSGYQGLRLWVRSGATSALAAKQVRLNLRTPPTMMGGGCTVCSDHFGAEIPLTSKWTQISVPFATLKQVGYGRPMLTSADLTQAIAIELLFPVNVSFDLWLDDIELY